MPLYIVLDQQKTSWDAFENKKQLLNNILVTINTYLLFSYKNQVFLVNNLEKKVIDHENRTSLENLTQFFANYTENNTLVRDIGLTLTIANKMKEKYEIVPLETNKTNSKADFQSIEQSKTFLSNNDACKILVISLSRESEKDYLNTLKLAFITRRYKKSTDIHIFSRFSNPALADLGHFHQDFELSTFLSVFTDIKPEKLCHSKAKCVCHNKEILYGLTCPVCLAIYCSNVPICKKCRCKFNFKKRSPV